ncbi:transcription factor HES-3 [Discoglossus pictus]
MGSFRKVSKPLMEKKRRARINVSLEQLKTLLEKNYSQNIRKRKLEKADILELTVKYMKTLQNSLQSAPLYRSAEYQAGFRNCLNGVSQFLLKSEENSHHVMQDLARALPAVSAQCISTMDSSLSPVSAHYEHKLPKVINSNTFVPAIKLTPMHHDPPSPSQSPVSHTSNSSRSSMQNSSGEQATALCESDEKVSSFGYSPEKDVGHIGIAAGEDGSTNQPPISFLLKDALRFYATIIPFIFVHNM